MTTLNIPFPSQPSAKGCENINSQFITSCILFQKNASLLFADTSYHHLLIWYSLWHWLILFSDLATILSNINIHMLPEATTWSTSCPPPLTHFLSVFPQSVNYLSQYSHKLDFVFMRNCIATEISNFWIHSIASTSDSTMSHVIINLYKITIPLRPAIHSLAGVHQNTVPTLLFSFGLLIYNPFDKAINFISPFYQAHLGNAACTSKLQRHDFSFIAEQMNAGNEKSQSLPGIFHQR